MTATIDDQPVRISDLDPEVPPDNARPRRDQHIGMGAGQGMGPGDAPLFDDTHRLEPVYCAERAAAALLRAEAIAGFPDGPENLIRIAERWEMLGRTLASTQGMLRRPPRDPDDDRR